MNSMSFFVGVCSGVIICIVFYFSIVEFEARKWRKQKERERFDSVSNRVSVMWDSHIYMYKDELMELINWKNEMVGENDE